MTLDTMATSLQAKIGLEEVPRERFGTMVLRCFIGGLIALVGVGVLYVMGRLALASAAPSALLVIVLLSAGGGMLFIGGHIISGQIRKALMDFVSPIDALRRAIRGTPKGE